MTQARDMLGLLRPHQWIKNGFVLLPPFFAFMVSDAARAEGTTVKP